MDIEAILELIAPYIDPILGDFLDFVANAGNFLGISALLTGIYAFFGNLFAMLGISFI